mmetsp:Transcript_19888/g.59604  ORF Transcript_19888/g.59604 Transcript_19888/m.59604 type:complete len:265 (-) Transcript_19888:8-802(-)
MVGISHHVREEIGVVDLLLPQSLLGRQLLLHSLLLLVLDVCLLARLLGFLEEVQELLSILRLELSLQPVDDSRDVLEACPLRLRIVDLGHDHLHEFLDVLQELAVHVLEGVDVNDLVARPQLNRLLHWGWGNLRRRLLRRGRLRRSRLRLRCSLRRGIIVPLLLRLVGVLLRPRRRGIGRLGRRRLGRSRLRSRLGAGLRLALGLRGCQGLRERGGLVLAVPTHHLDGSADVADGERGDPAKDRGPGSRDVVPMALRCYRDKVI